MLRALPYPMISERFYASAVLMSKSISPWLMLENKTAISLRHAYERDRGEKGVKMISDVHLPVYYPRL